DLCDSASTPAGWLARPPDASWSVSRSMAWLEVAGGDPVVEPGLEPHRPLLGRAVIAARTLGGADEREERLDVLDVVRVLQCAEHLVGVSGPGTSDAVGLVLHVNAGHPTDREPELRLHMVAVLVREPNGGAGVTGLGVELPEHVLADVDRAVDRAVLVRPRGVARLTAGCIGGTLPPNGAFGNVDDPRKRHARPGLFDERSDQRYDGIDVVVHRVVRELALQRLAGRPGLGRGCRFGRVGPWLDHR